MSEYAASVLAGNDFMRSAFGELPSAPGSRYLFARTMFDDFGVDWVSPTLGFLADLLHSYRLRSRFTLQVFSCKTRFAALLIPTYIGETLRKKYCKHARKDI